MSETENIRNNLAIERMITEGCDILLDVNQMFVRQGKKNSFSCFTSDPVVQNFPRRSIDFPRMQCELLINEDNEDRGKPRAQRSCSTVSCLSREQLVTLGRRRLSSIRPYSLEKSGVQLGSQLGSSTVIPVSINDGSEPEGRRMSVKMSDVENLLNLEANPEESGDEEKNK